MRLQVLGNDPLALQCAKLKVREVSGGRNRPGAGLVSRAHTFHRRPPEAPCSLSLPLSLSLNHFAKNLPLFLRRFQLLMFVNKVCRVLLSNWIQLCFLLWLSFSSPNPPDIEHNSWHRLGRSCSVLSGEKIQKSLIIFPRNWELFYSSLKFVVSELTRDHNTLRAGAAPSPLTCPTSSIKHYNYRVTGPDWV